MGRDGLDWIYPGGGRYRVPSVQLIITNIEARRVKTLSTQSVTGVKCSATSVAKMICKRTLKKVCLKL